MVLIHFNSLHALLLPTSNSSITYLTLRTWYLLFLQKQTTPKVSVSSISPSRLRSLSNRSNRSNSQGRRTPLGNLPRTIATPAYSKYSASLTPASDSLSIHSRADFIASEHSPGWNVSHVYTPDSVASRRSMFSQSTVGDEGEGARSLFAVQHRWLSR